MELRNFAPVTNTISQKSIILIKTSNRNEGLMTIFTIQKQALEKFKNIQSLNVYFSDETDITHSIRFPSIIYFN